MKFPHLIVLALGLFCVPDTFARLGETVAECEQRYGTATKLDSKTFSFKKAGFAMMITFFEGKADSITYVKEDLSHISENQQSQLRKLHSADLEWTKSKDISTNNEWNTPQNEFWSHYYTVEKLLVVGTRGWVERLDAEKKAKEDKAIKGL